MKSYNTKLHERHEFKTQAEAMKKRLEILNDYMQVVVCPVVKYKKEVWKVIGNYKLIN